MPKNQREEERCAQSGTTVRDRLATSCRLGSLPDQEPGPGEVRVRVRYSGVNPGDTKKRRGWLGSSMPYPRVIPHSDAAGVVDAVGEGVTRDRVGRRVWVYGAQSTDPFGTAAQYTVVPEQLAVDLPDDVPDDVGACLGIPGITAHRAVFGDGPVAGATVLVHGVLGGGRRPGRPACPLGRGHRHWHGRSSNDPIEVDTPAVDYVVPLDRPDPAADIRAVAPDGVDRIIEVAFSGNVDLDAAVGKIGTVIAAYASRQDRPTFPFWPMLFNNMTIRLLGSDDFPSEAKEQAATDLTAAARDGALSITIGETLPLERVAEAHDLVDAGTRHRVVVALS